MDELEPGDGRPYFNKLKDSRGEMTALRPKLRKIKKTNPDHQAVRFHVKGEHWDPPDQATLDALILLIKRAADGSL